MPRIADYPDFPDDSDDDPFYWDDLDDDEPPRRWYRKPVTVIALAALGVVAVAVPIFGLIRLLSSDSAEAPPERPATAPVSAPSTTADSPMAPFPQPGP